MASYNISSDLFLDSDISCDICNSANIQEIAEGYVCGDCGVVLEILKLQYHHPYDDSNVQYAPLGKTQIGTTGERNCSPNAHHLRSLNKLNSLQNNEKLVCNRARDEIKKIFGHLQLPKSYEKTIFKQFKKTRSQFRPGTKFRSVEKLVPIVIYHTFKLENIVINSAELLNVTGIDKKEFNAFKLQYRKYNNEYKTRNRQEYVVQKILQITESFGLGMEFFYTSKKIMYKLWELIKNTTDEVIAGVTTSISALCSYKDEVSVHSLCKKLGIRMSTIQFQVRERIFKGLKVDGFESLVRSRDLLRMIIEKLGLLEPKEKPADIVEIILGNASQVFNFNKGVNYYMFAVKTNHNNPVIITVEMYNPIINNRLARGYGVEREKSPDLSLDYKFLYYHMAKGPPLSAT